MHKLQGIGAGFIPKVMDISVLNEVVKVSAEDAGSTARATAANEGMLVGISSGAALWAALELSKRPEFEGKTIVALLPDTGERYLSTWLFD
jgi:cysteine synthase A